MNFNYPSLRCDTRDLEINVYLYTCINIIINIVSVVYTLAGGI